MSNRKKVRGFQPWFYKKVRGFLMSNYKKVRGFWPWFYKKVRGFWWLEDMAALA